MFDHFFTNFKHSRLFFLCVYCIVILNNTLYFISYKMTTTTATITTGLPKNKTGLFAGDTLREVKSIRNQSHTKGMLSAQHHQNASTNLLLASSEQSHHQFQQRRL